MMKYLVMALLLVVCSTLPAQESARYLIYHHTFTESSVSDPFEVDNALAYDLRSPSIAVTPGDIVHVAWNRGERIMYREHRDGLWSDIYPISTTYPLITEPAENPALEAYGEHIYCVWRGPNEQGQFPADVWQRRRWIWNPPDIWSTPEYLGLAPGRESERPPAVTDPVLLPCALPAARTQSRLTPPLPDTQLRMKRTALLPAGPGTTAHSRIICCDSDQDGLQEVIFYTGSLRPGDPMRWEVWEYRPVNRYELVYADTGAYPYPPGITTGNLRISDCGDLDADSLFDLTGLNVDYQGPGSTYSITPMHESPTRYQHPESLVWSTRYATNTTDSPLARYTGDLDADTREEILSPCAVGTLIYENVGDNRNELVWQRGIDGGVYAIEDFDGDGRKEFVTANLSGGRVSLFECVGDNQYEQTYGDTVGLPNGHDVFSGRDFDPEGKPRFFVRFWAVPLNRWYLYLWEPLGNNRFLRVQVDEKTLVAGGAEGRSVCGDLDGDGFSEVVWAVPTGLFVYKATGHNQFEQVWNWWCDHGPYESVDTRIRDMNGNGYNDLVASGSFKTSFFEVEAVRVLYPNGGEELAAGDTCRVRWQTFTPPECDSVSLFLMTDTVVRQGEWFWDLDTVVTGLAPDESSYAWVVPDTVLDAAWIVAIAYGPGWQHDLSDTPFRIVPAGVKETGPSAWQRWTPQTVLRGALPVPEGIRALLLDITGRQVMELRPGENDVRHLAPGVYFIKEHSAVGIQYSGRPAASREPSAVRKVVIQR